MTGRVHLDMVHTSVQVLPLCQQLHQKSDALLRKRNFGEITRGASSDKLTMAPSKRQRPASFYFDPAYAHYITKYDSIGETEGGARNSDINTGCVFSSLALCNHNSRFKNRDSWSAAQCSTSLAQYRHGAIQSPSSDPIMQFKYDLSYFQCSLLYSPRPTSWHALPAPEEENFIDDTSGLECQGNEWTQFIAGQEAFYFIVSGVKNIRECVVSFPCATIRLAAEQFCRGYQPTLKVSSSFRSSSIADNTSVREPLRALCDTENFEGSVTTSCRPSFQFYGSCAFGGNKELPLGVDEVSASKSAWRDEIPKRKTDPERYDANEFMLLSHMASRVDAAKGLAGELAYMLCRDASTLIKTHACRLSSAGGNTVMRETLEAAINKAFAHAAELPSGRIFTICRIGFDSITFSRLAGAFHVMYFVFQALDMALSLREAACWKERNDFTSSKMKCTQNRGGAENFDGQSGCNSAQVTAAIIALLEAAHVIWLHLIANWSLVVVSLGYVDWWLQHSLHRFLLTINLNATKKDRSQKQDSEHCNEEEEEKALVAKTTETHRRQLLSAFVDAVHSLASSETWGRVLRATGEGIFQGFSPSFFLSTSGDILYDGTSLLHSIHDSGFSKSSPMPRFWPCHHFLQPETHTLKHLVRQDAQSNRRDNKVSLGRLARESFLDATNYQKLQLDALHTLSFIRLLYRCVTHSLWCVQSLPPVQLACEDTQFSYLLLFALCRLGNSVPPVIFAHLEHTSLSFLNTFHLTSTGAAGASAFISTLRSVYAELTKLAGVMATRLDGMRLEMKTDLIRFIGRLRRLRATLTASRTPTLPPLRNCAEFDMELEKLEALTLLAQ